MDNISFKSSIRACSMSEFSRFRNTCLRNSVYYPWRLKESVYAPQAYTESVYDCTVCGITDGLKVLLLHICPTVKENLDFSKIKEFVCSRIKVGNPDLQGFLLGSVPNTDATPCSTDLFEYFERMLKEFGIPFSKLKGSRESVNVGYSSVKDEWIVGCRDLKEDETSQEALKSRFNEVVLSNLDEFA